MAVEAGKYASSPYLLRRTKFVGSPRSYTDSVLGFRGDALVVGCGNGMWLGRILAAKQQPRDGSTGFADTGRQGAHRNWGRASQPSAKPTIDFRVWLLSYGRVSGPRIRADGVFSELPTY
jgi:hypothetical protein